MPIEVICDNCGKVFQRYPADVYGRTNFCSTNCMYEYRRTGRVVICDYCGKRIYRSRSKIRRNRHHFCSNECEAEWKREHWRGKGHPCYDEIELECLNCGKIFSVIRAREHTAKFCSGTCRNKYYWENGALHEWLHKKAPEQTTLYMFTVPYHLHWNRTREGILTRDGFKCLVCGSRKNLEVHHIDRNPFNNSLKNLITLCGKCHRKVTSRVIQLDEVFAIANGSCQKNI